MIKFKVPFENTDGKELIAIAVFEPSKNNDLGMAFDSLYIEEILDTSDEEKRSIIENYEDIILNEAEKIILAW